jgi:hypothetical protein
MSKDDLSVIADHRCKVGEVVSGHLHQAMTSVDRIPTEDLLHRAA